MAESDELRVAAGSWEAGTPWEWRYNGRDAASDGRQSKLILIIFFFRLDLWEKRSREVEMQQPGRGNASKYE